MLLTLALVILGASIAIFFSQEFIGLFKKIWIIKGVEIFIPLAIASWLVFSFSDWVLWVLNGYKNFLNQAASLLAVIIPGSTVSFYIAVILVLTVIAVVPVWLIERLLKIRTYKPYAYPQLTSIFIWLLSVFALMVYDGVVGFK